MGTHILTQEQGYSSELTGNVSVLVLTPPINCRFVVKGMLIHGEGNNGISSIIGSSGRLLLRLYHSNQSTVSPSGRTSIDLEEFETISFVTTGRGVGDRTFMGVSVEVEVMR